MTTGEDKEVQGYDFFLSAHAYQLKTSEVPENLWPVLHEKLSKQVQFMFITLIRRIAFEDRASVNMQEMALMQVGRGTGKG